MKPVHFLHSPFAVACESPSQHFLGRDETTDPERVTCEHCLRFMSRYTEQVLAGITHMAVEQGGRNVLTACGLLTNREFTSRIALSVNCDGCLKGPRAT